MSQAMQIPDAKAEVDKEWKTFETAPAWDLGEVKSTRRLFWKHKDKKKSPLCHTDGHRSLQKKAELEPELQKFHGRVVLRGDCVQDDSGAHAVFTEQGSSASQMTAAKIMNVFARPPNCD